MGGERAQVVEVGKGSVDDPIVDLEVIVDEDVSLLGRLNEPLAERLIYDLALAQPNEDVGVGVGGSQSELCDQLSADVDADLLGELERALGLQAQSAIGEVSGLAARPDPLQHLEQRLESVESVADPLRVDQSVPRRAVAGDPRR